MSEQDTKGMHKRGFTLIELLVVIAIIGILSTTVLAALNESRVKARDARRVSDLKQIQNALELYYNDNGYYPRLQHGLGYDTGSSCGGPQVTGCGHCNRWCTLATELQSYIDPLPREPLGDTTSYHYSYTANAGDDWQSYGLYAILETEDALAQNDGGYWPSSSSGTERYEVGPHVAYCMANYTGTDRNWFDGKSPWSNVCVGGN